MGLFRMRQLSLAGRVPLCAGRLGFLIVFVMAPEREFCEPAMALVIRALILDRVVARRLRYGP
jgi:hypothetical protein